MSVSTLLTRFKRVAWQVFCRASPIVLGYVRNQSDSPFPIKVAALHRYIADTADSAPLIHAIAILALRGNSNDVVRVAASVVPSGVHLHDRAFNVAAISMTLEILCTDRLTDLESFIFQRHGELSLSLSLESLCRSHVSSVSICWIIVVIVVKSNSLTT